MHSIRFITNQSLLIFGAICAERMGYYLFRPAFFQHLTGNCGLQGSVAIEFYRFLGLIILILLPLGGLLSDVLRTNRWTGFSGAILMACGMLSVLTGAPGIFMYLSLVIIAMGHALFYTSVLKQLVFTYRSTGSRIDGAWMLMYLFINIGAFISGTLQPQTVEFNTYVTILIAALAVILSAVFPLFFQPQTSELPTPPKSDSTPPIHYGILLLAGLFLATISFRFITMGNYQFTELYRSTGKSAATSTLYTTLESGISLVMYCGFGALFLLVPVKTTYKLVASLIAVSTSFLLMKTASSALFSFSGMLIFMLLSALSETLFTPVTYTFISRTIPYKWIGTAFGCFIGIAYVVIDQIQELTASRHHGSIPDFFIWITGITGIAMLIWAGLVFKRSQQVF